MAKLAQNFAKYVIHAQLEASGVVEKPDIIGAVFGQTEGLLGTELDLRELQRTGRIGRIEVNVKTVKGQSTAEIIIPSSLDSSETALIAAALETIDKVGPCDARITISKIEDVRAHKRQYVVDRAKELLRDVLSSGTPEAAKLSEEIKSAVRTYEVGTWEGLSCGPDVLTSDEIIIVEGRADVLNLLRAGIRNCIAIEGTKIPEAIIQLTKEKITTALLDGDRGGDLILKKLLAVADIDFIARAEQGKEVEELTKKEIHKALRDRKPIDEQMKRRMMEDEFQEPLETKTINDFEKNNLGKLLQDLLGSRAAYLLDSSGKVLSKIPLSELSYMISDFKGVTTIVADTKINQALVDLALQHKVRCLVGTGIREPINRSGLLLLTPEQLKQ